MDYVLQSIIDPDAFIVPQYVGGVMRPPDEPPISLSDDDVLALATFLSNADDDATINAARAKIAAARDARTARRAKSPAQATLAAIDWSKGDPTRGQAAWKRLGCAGCHVPDAQGHSRAPALAGVGKRLAPIEIGRWVIDAPPAKMPSFASSISGAELADLASYVASL
jgi:mono/diheme cytochrome c family protein